MFFSGGSILPHHVALSGPMGPSGHVPLQVWTTHCQIRIFLLCWDPIKSFLNANNCLARVQSYHDILLCVLLKVQWSSYEQYCDSFDWLVMKIDFDKR